MMQTNPAHYRGNDLALARLWVHECMRIFHDRLIFEEDREMFMNFLKNGLKEFSDFKEEQLLENPLIYTSFVSAAEGHEKSYLPIKDLVQLKNVLEGKLAEYNENVSSMNLVLFDQAMEHICRIARIIDLPVGNALLVGVGGSGKQSLAKLSSFILGYDVIRIIVTTNYNMNDLKTDIQAMYQKAGVQGAQLLFILTDGQITNDKFLVYINDILSSGWIPELFAKDEIDGILGKVRSEAKQAGFLDTPDQLFEFFLNKARKNLHLALCFSPVGDAFRFRARKFPGIINCTSIDWFHDWPRNALVDVASRFLSEIDFPTDDIRDAVGQHMADVHLSIADANIDFLRLERRFNYTTPTSFLELISFYRMLLDKKRDKITDQIDRLEIGLGIMKATIEQVEGLQKLLDIKMVDVEQEKAKTGELIEIVGRESLDAQREQDLANIQATETNKLAAEAEAVKATANKELEEAIPAMKAAEAAVACLDKKSIQELKSLASPPPACLDVAKGCLLLKGEKKNFAWGNAQKMMNNPAKFIEEVQQFDGSSIDQWILD
jgi:dynein heavy chain